MLRRVSIFALSYVFFSFILYGGSFRPIELFYLGLTRHLPPLVFYPSLLICFTTAWFLTAMVNTSSLAGLKPFTPFIFTGLVLVLPIITLTAITRVIQHDRLQTLAPDLVQITPLYRSIRFKDLTQDVRFQMHAIALKDCQAYLWSYSELKFIPLPDTIVVNIFPSEWIETCHIMR